MKLGECGGESIRSFGIDGGRLCERAERNVLSINTTGDTSSVGLSRQMRYFLEGVESLEVLA